MLKVFLRCHIDSFDQNGKSGERNRRKVFLDDDDDASLDSDSDQDDDDDSAIIADQPGKKCFEISEAF